MRACIIRRKINLIQVINIQWGMVLPRLCPILIGSYIIRQNTIYYIKLIRTSGNITIICKCDKAVKLFIIYTVLHSANT